VELAELWQLDHFKIDNVEFDVSYRGGEGGGASADLHATLAIGKSHLLLRAAHAGPDQGWDFEGSLIFPQDDPFTIQTVADHFQVGDRIGGLENLAKVGVVSLQIAYSTK